MNRFDLFFGALHIKGGDMREPEAYGWLLRTPIGYTSIPRTVEVCKKGIELLGKACQIFLQERGYKPYSITDHDEFMKSLCTLGGTIDSSQFVDDTTWWYQSPVICWAIYHLDPEFFIGEMLNEEPGSPTINLRGLSTSSNEDSAGNR